MFSTVLFISLFVSAYGQAVPYNPESPEAAFQRMDTDNNGLITVEDYFHRDPWYTQYTQKTFGDMDVNGDGKVSVTEYQTYHNMIAEAMKKEAEKTAFSWANNTISTYDKDGDDMINMAELDTFLRTELRRTSKNLESVIEPKFLSEIPMDKLDISDVPKGASDVKPVQIMF